MKKLEERVRSIPVGLARKAFKDVSVHFESDEHLTKALHAKLAESYPEEPIAYYTVRSSFQDHRQPKMNRRISDLIIDWSKQLKREHEIGVPEFMRQTRGEATRIVKELHAMVEPLMDFYQFKNRRNLDEFIAQEYSLGEIKNPYTLIWGVFTGFHYKTLTPAIEKLQMAMVDLLRRAERHEPVKVQPHFVITQKDSKVTESLTDFTERAISAVLNGHYDECRRYVKTGLEKFRRVQQLVNLVRGLPKAYPFSHKKSAYDYILHLMNIDVPETGHFFRHGQRDLEGDGRPVNVHRKIYTAALILDFSRKKGLQANIDPEYLSANYKQYRDEINRLKEHGIPAPVSEELLSSILGVPKASTRAYFQRTRKSIPYDKFMELQVTINRRVLPVFVIDLSEIANRESEYKRFMSNYHGGKVLVKTRKTIDKRDVQLLAEIRDVAYDSGLPFIYPTPRRQIPEVAGYLHQSELFKVPYKK